ncbi:chymotrypsin-1-like [Phymastichus coffea]|uniref:chymotrypsin-1-like n=1 Tax=Phymastichus coffea TaxID=108790 RepID=UPI00273C382B|nr:chymotrypsin-1-like [Phymastichus coffea]
MIRIIYLFALCAVTSADVTSLRIKGGNTAAPGEFPYQVSVQINEQHVCGGALVTMRHVVTSGSCLVNILRNPQLFNQLKVIVGTMNLRKDGMVCDVSKVTLHPEYQWDWQWSSFENDIGMIHLRQNVQPSRYVQQVNLPAITELPQNSELLFTGWGSVNNPSGPSIELLQKAKLRSISKQECQKYFPNLNVKQYQICTSPNNYLATCTTDQGGPLTYGNQLVGISTGIHGCAGGVPDVFTKVSYYLKFIVNDINSN